MAHNSFYPRYSFIESITNSIQALVTFTEDHDFTPGEIVSFRVGKDFGMDEINNKRAKVLVITDDTILVDIDTSTWTPFSLSNLNEPGTSPPVCVPSASSVIPFQENPSVNIEDAFDNRRN
jgi:hypothetical protein